MAAGTRGTAFAALLSLLLLAGLPGCIFSESQTPARDDPALAAKVKTAIGDVSGAPPIRRVTADSKDSVNITLAVQTKDMPGAVGGRDVASALANTVFTKVPEAMEIGVFDSGAKIIDLYVRQGP